MTKLFLDILDEPRRRVLSQLGQVIPGAVLGGGTGLALQLGHRQSYDFDLFVSHPVTPALYESIRLRMGEAPLKRMDSEDQLTVQLKNGVEITVLHYWYPALYPFISGVSVPLFDPRDIAADKALTIGRRNVWRDYIDFFYLLHDRHTSLSGIIEDAQKRFSNSFSTKLFLEQLSYFKDIAEFTYVPVGKSYAKEEIQAFLMDEVKRYIQEKLKL